MDKKEAIEKWVERNFHPIPTEWIRIVTEKQDGECPALPMWGTMWQVDDYIGKKLWKHSHLVREPSECKEEGAHEEDETCDKCEDWEEMGGTHNIYDKDGSGTSAYIYDIDDVYLVGIHGAGWDFYEGVWDKLYDLFGIKWHENI